MAAGSLFGGPLSGCAGSGPPTPRWVIFVTIDTLRADHVGWHGYPRNTTPFLDGLAREAVLFQHAYSSTSHTNPAHASMFTALEMPQHRIYANRQAAMDPGIWTMAQMFRESGYETAAFCGVSFLSIMNRGFDTFESPDWEDDPQNHYRQANDTVDRALAWLAKRSEKDRLFLWIHLYDPHTPYLPPDDCRAAMCSPSGSELERLLDHWTKTQHKDVSMEPWLGDTGAFAEEQSSYDAEIRFVDRELKRLHAHVARCGPSTKTLWVITSDHGEGLGGHGYRSHGMFVYNEQIHVPLLLHFSSGAFAGKQIGHVARHVDLLPTLAELTGNDVARQVVPIEGQSLLPAVMEGHRPDAPLCYAFAQRRRKTEIEEHTHGWEDDDVYCVQDGVFKFIYRPVSRCQFYNIRADPYETVNLVSRRLRQCEVMEAYAKELFASLTADGKQISESVMTDDHSHELEALGYF